MSLEQSDLSDGAILESTQQFQNGNGQVQFKITLPSGRELESEWLSPDMKKKAMVQWLDVVKDQAILDADQARAEAREVAMKLRREPQSTSQESQAQTTVPATSAETPSSIIQTSTVQPAGMTNPAAAPSPDAYVEAGLKAAQANYNHWDAVAAEAVTRLTEAGNNIDKWMNIKKALEGHEQSSSNNWSGDTGSGGTDSRTVRRRKKRAVAKSTDFQEPDVSDTSVRGT